MYHVLFHLFIYLSLYTHTCLHVDIVYRYTGTGVYTVHRTYMYDGSMSCIPQPHFKITAVPGVQCTHTQLQKLQFCLS
jgi:hypothetical protein